MGAYGRTKLAGEEAFMASGVKGAVVRAAWLYDAEGHNFMNTMLRLAQTHGALRVVDDQFGCPTAVPVLADALLDMALRGADMPQGCGILHTKGTPRGMGLRRKSCAWQLGCACGARGNGCVPTPRRNALLGACWMAGLCANRWGGRDPLEDALAQVWALKRPVVEMDV